MDARMRARTPKRPRSAAPMRAAQRPCDNRSTKSADGRVATGAAWLKGRNSQEERQKERKTSLQEKKKRKKNMIDTHRPSHGRSWQLTGAILSVMRSALEHFAPD